MINDPKYHQTPLFTALNQCRTTKLIDNSELKTNDIMYLPLHATKCHFYPLYQFLALFYAVLRAQNDQNASKTPCKR